MKIVMKIVTILSILLNLILAFNIFNSEAPPNKKLSSELSEVKKEEFGLNSKNAVDNGVCEINTKNDTASSTSESELLKKELLICRSKLNASYSTNDPQQKRGKISLFKEHLKNIAFDHLYNHWDSEKENILNSLEFTKNKEEIFRRAELDLENLSSDLGVAKEDIGRIRNEWESNFFEQMTDVRQLIEKKPVNWKQMKKVAESIFESRDQIIEREFGKEALKKYQNSKSRWRNTLRALFGQYSGSDWRQFR